MTPAPAEMVLVGGPLDGTACSLFGHPPPDLRVPVRQRLRSFARGGLGPPSALNEGPDVLVYRRRPGSVVAVGRGPERRYSVTYDHAPEG